MWQDLESPRGIAIDFEYGYLFFSDWGTTPRIERADMNGERRSRIVTSDLGWPNGLSVDKVEKKLYWTDALVSILHHHWIMNILIIILISLSLDDSH